MKTLFMSFVMGIAATMAIASTEIGAADPIGKVGANTYSPDTSATRDDVMLTVNGLESKEEGGGRAARAFFNAALYLPRTAVDGLLEGAGYAAFLFGDSRLLGSLDDFAHIYERKLGWFPQAETSSGSGVALGATLFYRDEPSGASLGGYYLSDDFYKAKLSLAQGFVTGRTVWRLSLSGKIKIRNDFEYYGFGADPVSDSRNLFLPGRTEEFGTFTQNLAQIKFVAGARPSDIWQFFYTALFRDRKLSIPEDQAIDNIDQTFDGAAIPGFSLATQGRSKQVYHELAARFDNRDFHDMLFPGFRAEGYAGISTGIDEDNSQFALFGIDAALYIPVIMRTRLLVPRVVFNQLENLDDDVEISFINYPHQPAFRGTGRRQLLRIDRISMMPSLEYEWPLTFNVRAHLFLDYLLVAESMDALTFSKAPYAYGIGFDLHSFRAERARLSLSNGSEGLRFTLTIGLSNHSSDRSKWE